jgi:hypothetical protein
VRKFVGAINGQSKFVTETFDNGYIFAWLIVLDTTINCPTFVNTFVFIIMSRSTALGLLSKAQTGNDILVCLDVIDSLLIDW